MKTCIVLAGALALAACGTNEAANNDSGAQDVPAATSQAGPPAELTVDNSEQTVPIAVPSPEPIAAIPASFQGRWGMVPNDCDPKNDYMAKGLMTVSAEGLKFYESRATIGDLQRLTPTRLQTTLSYSGEGQTWEKPTTLTLQDDGKTLVRTETDPPAAETYSRCPA
ncbi:MAG: hypothetical protein OSB00_16930 [Sphingomonas bacterium]|mgnify:CR=1 FL=1|nr:hypothetical protein [Sphingomonas bacterium]